MKKEKLVVSLSKDYEFRIDFKEMLDIEDCMILKIAMESIDETESDDERLFVSSKLIKIFEIIGKYRLEFPIYDAVHSGNITEITPDDIWVTGNILILERTKSEFSKWFKKIEFKLI